MKNEYHLKNEKYDEDSTPEDIEELKNSVQLIEGNVVYIPSVKINTVFRLNIIFNRVDELTKEISRYYLLIDGRDSIKKPTSDIKRYSKDRIQNIASKVIHIVLIFNDKKIFKIILPFISPFLFGNIKTKVYYNYESAINYLRKKNESSL